jgi:diguanylate cyclase (GGDEF)-like protein/PAS domain S-box-containing protein
VDLRSRTRRETLRKRLNLTAIALGIALVVFIWSIVLLVRDTADIRESAAQRRRLGEARIELQQVLVFLSDVQGEQRGSGQPGVVTSGADLEGIGAQTQAKLADIAARAGLADADRRAIAFQTAHRDRGDHSEAQLRAQVAAFNTLLRARQRAADDAILKSSSDRERLAIAASIGLLLGLGVTAMQVFRLLAAQRLFELALSSSEHRHRTLVEEQSEAITLVRANTILHYANPAFARMFGVPADEARGRSLLNWIVPADRDLLREKLREALTATTPIAVECRVHSQGPERWLSWRLQARMTENQQLIQAVGRDVSARKNAEAALRVSEDFLKRTNRMAGIGGWELHLGTGQIFWSAQVRRIHEVADDYVPTLESAIAFYSPEAQQRLVAAIDEARFRATPWDLELELTPTSGHSIYVRAVGAAERDVEGNPFRLIGTLQDVTDRKRLELELETKERFIRGITDSIPARLAYLGIDHRFQFVNRTLVERFKTPRERMIGCDILDVVVPSSRPGWEQAVTGVLDGRPQRYDYDDTVNGQVRRIEAQLIPDRNPDGEVRGFAIIGSDITHLKRVERELRDLTEVFDNTTDFVAQTDWQGRLLYINRSGRRALGFDPDMSLEGHTFQEFYTPATQELFLREIVPTIKRELVWIGETEVVLKQGLIVPVSHMVVGHLDSQGRVSRYSSIMRDITADIAARLELARQTASLNTVIEAIPAMVAVFDRDMRFVLVNRAYERWRGLSREQLTGRYIGETMEPLEYERSRPWALRALAGETVCYEAQYPHATQVRHVQVTYLPLRVPNGQIDGFFGVAHDITSHREENIRLALLSTHDPLTGALNRAGIDQFIQARVNAGEGATLAAVFIDLDHFKPVNDTYGHAAGDLVLQEFAARLQRLVKPTDGVARFGGDEFAVILLGTRDIADATKVAQAVVTQAQSPFSIDKSTHVSISASVGVAWNADAAGGWKALMAQADSLAYQAKGAGRGRIEVAPTTEWL